MAVFEIVKLGASQQHETTKAVQWQGVNQITGDDDSEDFGSFDVMQCLGVASAPWPADANGFAEAVIAKNCGNRDAIGLGGRDPRSSKAIGKLRPGDTVVYSTGPEAAAQLQLKESKRQVVSYTKDTDGTGMVVMLDGTNNKYQVLVRGAMIEIDDSGDMSLIGNGGASILLQGSHIYLNGNVHLSGMSPGLVLMQGPPSGSPGSVASVPLFPVLGVCQ